MGKKDLYQSEFYDDPRRFSDAFNGILFAGREVMKRKRLKYSRLAVWYHFSDFDEPHSSLK